MLVNVTGGGEGSGFIGFLKGIWRSIVDRWRALPQTSKNWISAGAAVFMSGCVMGGKVAEAAFIALLACAGAWALMIEQPGLAKWSVKAGFMADLIVTFGAFIFMPATVSAGFAVAFFAWFFTCARMSLKPLLPELLVAAKARKEQAKADAKALDAPAEPSHEDKKDEGLLTFPSVFTPHFAAA
tara:strand:+ start:138 stop:689 length:552 start_codon:yes stop_codon:yes gene_type:complete